MNDKDVSLSDLWQWKLFSKVRTIFTLDHVWTAREGDNGTVTFKLYTELIQAQFAETHLHELDIDRISCNINQDLQARLELLLGSLENLVEIVQDIPTANGVTEDDRFGADSEKSFPRLLATIRLLEHLSAAKELDDIGLYLTMSRDTDALAALCTRCQAYLTMLSDLTRKSWPSTDTETQYQRSSGYGKPFSKELPILDDEISTISLEHINKVVGKYLQLKDRDTPIKVAILDSGFDWNHNDFDKPRTRSFRLGEDDPSNPVQREQIQKSRVKRFHDFCEERPVDGDDTDRAEDAKDEDGHGTKVAGIVLRLAPSTELYIARVFSGQFDANGKPLNDMIKPEVVAEGVMWAIQQKVDIINMSFGFWGHHPGLITLDAALKEAQMKSIVVFAAAPNDGSHRDVPYPASNSSRAIGVHSCNDEANVKSKSSARPCKHGENFMTVGEHLITHRLSKKGGGFEVSSGSSFAAPVATSIAAFVLAFTRQQYSKKQRNEYGANLSALKENNGMIRVLKAISDENAEGYQFLIPQLFWREFEYQNEDMEGRAWMVIRKALAMS